MEPDTSGTVQYDRWNENNINMNVEASQPTKMRIYNRLCTGTVGILVKVAIALTSMVVIYIAGYMTGYHVHRCE
ncbi:small integral membrane protein 1 [Salarias fasciatus]|uniref:Small integral membrane protein 1 n=1 Tax=Salarias fasciatus TaxID=181472 RepID=A0A672IBU5_SALFA|nr:small integral membrane protein 1 [Salarias fasciatus]